MANIVVVGVGSTGIRVAESLQEIIPDAGFVAVGHFEKGDTSTIPVRINMRLKRKLSDDELVKYDHYLLRLMKREKPGDEYWWWLSKFGPMWPKNDHGTGGIALVRGQDIVASVQNVDSDVLLGMI